MGNSGRNSLEALRQTVERRLQEAEARCNRAEMLVEWQRELIGTMIHHGRGNLALAEEVLVSLLESQRWNEAQVNQIRKELEFLIKHSC